MKLSLRSKLKGRVRICFNVFLIFAFLFTVYSSNFISNGIDHNDSESGADSGSKVEAREVLMELPNYENIIAEISSRAPQNNSPPFFVKQLNDLELKEDFDFYWLNLVDYADDNENTPEELKWFITGENESLINISNENSSNQQIKITSVLNAFGENTVKLWVKDTTGQMVFREWTIFIEPVNDQPTILDSELPTLMVHRSSPYSINLKPYIVDHDTSKPLISITVEPEDRDYASINNYILKLDFKDTNDFNKNYITLKISDGVEFNTFSFVKIFVNLTDNHPPQLIKNIPQILIYQGEALSKILDLDYYFSDPDELDEKDTLKYEFIKNTNLIIQTYEDNTVDICTKPDCTLEGSEQIIIRCYDSGGAFKEQLVTVTITSISIPLILEPIPDINVHYGKMYKFNLSPYICQEKPQVIPSLEIYEFIEDGWVDSNIFSNIVVEEGSCPILEINYTNEYFNSTIPVFVSISYEHSQRFWEFYIKVSNNHPPTLKNSIPDFELEEDRELNSVIDLYKYFTDIEDGKLTFTNITNNILLTIDENGLMAISGKTDWFGKELVTIRAYDSVGAIIETSFYVTVTPINDPPRILPIPTINVTLGVLETFAYLEYLSDVDTNVSNLLVDSDSEYIEVAGTLLLINFPKDMEGKQSFILYVSDEENTTEQKINVDVVSKSDASRSKELQISPYMVWGILIVLIILMLSLLIMAIVYVRRLKAFRFNEIYLIYKDGVLIAHATRGTKISHDSDIIGSMFTAIQDFIQDSFSDSTDSIEGSPLKRLDFGDFQIVINRGEHIYIAAVYSGHAIRKMVLKIEKLRKQIENEFAEILPTWSGNMAQLKPTQKLIENLLHSTGTPRSTSQDKNKKLKRQKHKEPREKEQDVFGAGSDNDDNDVDEEQSWQVVDLDDKDDEISDKDLD